MSKNKEVVRCKICGKIYPKEIPYKCYKCGAKLLEDDLIIQLFFGNGKASLTENAERVSAKKKLFFKWDINRGE